MERLELLDSSSLLEVIVRLNATDVWAVCGDNNFTVPL